MDRLELDRESRTISYRGETVPLLPKEFELIQYLYRHAGQTLSREQLLDNVWPMEAPTDRTVDDHIYRLRKKLSPWRESFDIRTIRGAGYRFVVLEGLGRKAHPLLADAGYAETMRALVEKNILYGRGDALLMLAKQREVLGFELDPAFASLIPFLEGDFGFFIRKDHPFTHRAFFLLCIYHLMKPESSRPFVIETIRRRLLPPIWHEELERYIMISMLMDWGKLGAAKIKLDTEMQEAYLGKDANLLPYLSNLLLDYEIRTNHLPGILDRIGETERSLPDYPYQREEGRFYILKGIALYGKRPREAVASIDKGLSILRASRFVPHLANGIHSILWYAQTGGRSALADRYREDWDRLMRDTRLPGLLPSIESELTDHLLS